MKILPINNFYVLPILSFAGTKESKKTTEAPATDVSIYDKGVNYPENYNAEIQKAIDDLDEEEDYREEVQKLLTDVRELAEKNGRGKLFKSVVDREGMPVKGFDLEAVIQIGGNVNYDNKLLEKLVSKTKSQHGALFCQNFCTEEGCQLFGIEEYRPKNDNEFRIKTEFFSPEGRISASIDEYSGQYVYSRYNGGKNKTITKYKESDPRKIQRTLEYKLSLEYKDKNHLSKGRYTVSSPILEGAYNEFEYDLSHIEETDPKKVLELIQKGEIKPAGIISAAIRNKEGRITYFQNYKNTERIFTREEDGSTSQYLIIRDDNRDILYETSRVFNRINDNKAESYIDGKKYDISYDNDKRRIKIKSKEDTTEVDINSKIDNPRVFYRDILLMHEKEVEGILANGLDKKDDTINTEEDKNELWAQSKKLHADVLIALKDNIKYWTLDDTEDSYFVEGLLGTAKGSEAGVISHEIGHALCEEYYLKDDDNLIKTFYEEEKEFIKTHSGEEISALSYFLNNECPKEESTESGGGIDEVIAEVNCILNSQGIETDNIRLRTKFLLESFPKTVALLCNKYSNIQKKAPLEP